jgi:hypothetical protein
VYGSPSILLRNKENPQRKIREQLYDVGPFDVVAV